jgi:transcriptional regulator with XRE-family HTH domain
MVSTSSERRALGDRLKRHRERRGITLQAISQSTKIPAALFAGLERGDCSRWPVGLYSRAYVRAYAQAVGLNADETVDDFVSAFSATAHADGVEGAPAPVIRGTRTLRLGMVPEPAVTPEQIMKRVAVAGTDLVLASGVAWGTHALLDTTVLVTVGCALAYHTVGRLLSDEPLFVWLAHRLRSASLEPAPEPETGEVAVGDAASTTA